MTWVAASVAGAAVLGAYSQHQNAVQQQKQKKAEMMANASQMQFSPWTGAKVQAMGNDAPDPGAAITNGALQGGLTGGMMASQFTKAKPATPDTPPTGNPPDASFPAGSVQQQMTMQQQLQQPPNAAGGTWDQMDKPTMYGSPYAVPTRRA